MTWFIWPIPAQFMYLIFFLGAWTSSVQNSLQYIGIDLGSFHIVTQLFTQGRQGSDEYVTEYTLEFSTDNETWSDYTNEFGITEVCIFIKRL